MERSPNLGKMVWYTSKLSQRILDTHNQKKTVWSYNKKGKDQYIKVSLSFFGHFYFAV